MIGKQNARVVVVLSFFVFLALFAPVQLAFANPDNQMINNEWLQNPENPQETPAAADPEEPNSAAVGLGAWDYIKMFISLVFVLGLLILVLKFMNKKSRNFQQNSLVQNIGGISVGSQKSVQLLHIGDSLYIVGVGENVQLLKEIQDPEEIEQLLNYYNEKQSTISTTPYVAELFKKFRSKQNDGSTTQVQSDFGDLLNKRLSDIKKERHDELEKWKEKESDK